MLERVLGDFLATLCTTRTILAREKPQSCTAMARVVDTIAQRLSGKEFGSKLELWCGQHWHWQTLLLSTCGTIQSVKS